MWWFAITSGSGSRHGSNAAAVPPGEEHRRESAPRGGHSPVHRHVTRSNPWNGQVVGVPATEPYDTDSQAEKSLEVGALGSLRRFGDSAKAGFCTGRVVRHAEAPDRRKSSLPRHWRRTISPGRARTKLNDKGEAALETGYGRLRGEFFEGRMRRGNRGGAPTTSVAVRTACNATNPRSGAGCNMPARTKRRKPSRE